MSKMQTAAFGGGRCGIADPNQIKPQTTISAAILQTICRSEDGETTALAAALRAALARKAGRQ